MLTIVKARVSMPLQDSLHCIASITLNRASLSFRPDAFEILPIIILIGLSLKL